MSFDALILAGSREERDPMAGLAGYRHKALIEIAGKPSLLRVIEAVREGGASEILVSCNHPDVVALAQQAGARVVATAASPSRSVMAAIAGREGPLLVTTADHALLRPEWVRDLIEGTRSDSDLALMMAHKDVIEAALPGSRRTYYRFADGGWSGCNLFYLRTERAHRLVEVWQAVEQERKKPWRVAGRLGWRNLLDYVLGRLTMAQAVERVGRRFGLAAQLVPARNGLAAVDIDKPEDLAEVLALVAD